MGYFRKFPTIQYNGVDVQNILTAVLPSRLNIDKSFVYQKYTVGDGESPEAIAEKLYKNAQYYWVLLVANSIINPYIDWPIENEIFDDWVTKKYGDKFAVHHFWNNQINRIVDDYDEADYRLVPVSTLPFYIVPVSNLEYEREVNNRKREIVVINPRYVDRFIETYNDAVEGKS